jgi:electron transport complex protein RnfG
MGPAHQSVDHTDAGGRAGSGEENVMSSGNKGYLREAWLVLALSLCFGATLAGVQTALNPKIEQNKLNDTLNQIPKLVPGAVGGEKKYIGDQIVYAARDEQGAIVGWVVAAAGHGFADRIELLVGLDKDARRTTGLYILDQKETPGLGNKVTEDTWLRQFVGRPTESRLQIVKRAPAAEHEVQGVTGATISSESVVGIVNAAVAQFRARLAEGGLP